MSDVWDDPTAERWARHVIDEMVPNMASSSACVSLYPRDGSTSDVKYWVELGAMICMDKPILVVVMGDAVLPPKLALVADEVVRLPDGVSPGASEELAGRIADFVRGRE